MAWQKEGERGAGKEEDTVILNDNDFLIPKTSLSMTFSLIFL